MQIKRAITVALLSLSLAAFTATAFAQTKNDAAGDAKSAQPQLYTSSLKAGATPKITANQAQIAALTANQGAVSKSVELESESGQLIYSVSLNTGAEVKVDAGNGSILYTGVSMGNDERRGHDGRDLETNDDGNDNADQTD